MGINLSLANKVAIVTGASRGIGEAIARTFAENGAKVVLSSRKQESLEGVASSIKKSGGEALAVACHTGKMEMIDALYDKVMSAYGRVDILVNNAATNPYFGSALHISESEYDKTFDVNTKGYFFMAQKAGKIMSEQKSGSIINIASVAGIRASQMQAVYGMTKAAVILMTKAYAKELGPYGVRCNAICPGLTETHFASVLIQTKEIYEIALKDIPLGRHAQPSEIAGAALYLASDASSFTTGSVIVVDGGGTA
ncbi:MAG: glucose 1-dehydrogenase [Candidatus Abyssobacteria bacterium SURF_17]|jgi:NAD(P)-dependent dehydrogenase (short-subunit alcohol dehydrogenase family)|uniref:Glucose 1-dehydrogenase n=1 Tax=Candidatus Abyssobacteria bacterium SURF_17 TaxID=2093361 RepID=A0A419F328_9BACT|nr:MAG: glucose 1-dehydrogenase [Candidatus Abyssubacteria bacterium SURF_17]